MFQIIGRQEQFYLYELANESGTMMEVVPERGGLVTRWRVHGQDIFYLDESTLLDMNKNVRGGNPVLFPICGPSSKGFKQHGFARNCPWHVCDSGTAEECAWITLELKQPEPSFDVYPYPFVLRFKYVLTNSSLRIEQCYRNTGQRDMPFHAGFHPYFGAKSKEQLNLSLQAESMLDMLTGHQVPFKGQLQLDDLAEYNYVFGPLTQQDCIFSGHNGNQSLKLSFQTPFKYVVFWTLPGRPFICVEPWMASNRSFETGEDLQWLPPNSELNTVVEYSLL